MHSGGTTAGSLFGGPGSTVQAASPAASLQASQAWLQAAADQATAAAVATGAAPGLAGFATSAVGIGALAFLLILIYLDRRILE